ncbi:MAG: hypothetical protein FWD22_05485, partial [Treponema sp.]|nr:hypothetical protein [Treponema sp.]
EQIRTQWIFRDDNGNTRLNAVFMEPDSESVPEDEYLTTYESVELIITDDTDEDIQHEDEPVILVFAEESNDLDELKESDEISEFNEETEEEVFEYLADIKNRRGFLEIFNEDLYLTSEYRFYEDGRSAKTDYTYNNNLLIKAEYLTIESYEEREYKTAYVDHYRYNRTLSLRTIERVFHYDMHLSDPVSVTFPRRIMDAAIIGIFSNERLNLYPEFFGDVFVGIGSRLIYDTDNRGRVVSQTLYDSEDSVIWFIINTWHNNRIISTTKTEGDLILTAEFVYNSDGDRIIERNIKNGVMERVVRAEGDLEIEELYMNNVVVLRAIWEDGRKISEVRVIN